MGGQILSRRETRYVNNDIWELAFCSDGRKVNKGGHLV